MDKPAIRKDFLTDVTKDEPRGSGENEMGKQVSVVVGLPETWPFWYSEEPGHFA